MDSLIKEWNSFLKPHKAFCQDSVNEIDNILKLLQQAKSTSTDPVWDNIKLHSSSAIDSVKKTASHIHKLGKCIDQVFPTSTTTSTTTTSTTTSDSPWQTMAALQHNIVHKIIAEHFVRQGNTNLALAFQKEAKLDNLDTTDTNFQLLNQHIANIRARKLNDCITWAETNRFDLNRIDSDLEFQLHKLACIQLFLESNPSQTEDQDIMTAIDYASHHLSRFPDRISEIQQLVAFMIFMKHNSTTIQGKDPTFDPHNYARFTSIKVWDDLEQAYARDFCTLVGLSPDSPLFTTVMVGTSAQVIMSRMFVKMKLSKADVTAMYELPVEVPLLPSHHFHSIFTCPVTREQATELNPPMMLPCGHTISSESVEKLSRNSTTRFKCPYCPCDTAANQALRVHI